MYTIYRSFFVLVTVYIGCPFEDTRNMNQTLLHVISTVSSSNNTNTYARKTLTQSPKLQVGAQPRLPWQRPACGARLWRSEPDPGPEDPDGGRHGSLIAIPSRINTARFGEGGGFSTLGAPYYWGLVYKEILFLWV